MISKVVILVWFVVFCGLVSQVYGDDDDCGADTDLNVSNVRFTFLDQGVVVRWSLRTPTNCSIEYHLVVQDSDLGVIRDEYLEEESVQLDAMSACTGYNVTLRAVNKAIPSPEGPFLTTSIQFHSRAQIAPILKSLDVETTSIKTTWLLEGEGNRCPLRNFYVNGGNFNFSIPLEDLADRSVVPVEIKSLQPNTMYYFQVSVENSAGLSPPTPVAVQTLHE
ncbi:uncharacterized protein LOC111691454 [Anoplophora glabripennis]|uniref:uncharacterized protein LOC111691454 n=1 Tax=Anoplophora glabripennis TaxID=217634 RepID=UPI000C77EB4E|nr:uncharacterized protein LOC111691454 [Anoplophora glabripennis]